MTITKGFVIRFFLIAIGILFLIEGIKNLRDDPAPNNEHKYGFEYLTKERTIELKEIVSDQHDLIMVDWHLWFDGEIIGYGSSDWMPAKMVPYYNDKMREWANNKIGEIVQIKNDR